MTQPIPQGALKLPDAHYPILNRVLSSPPFTAEGVRPEDQRPIVWTVSETHPLLPDYKIVRMFMGPDGIEVFAGRNDGKIGIRNTVPWHMVRLSEETMDAETFVDEIALAEKEGIDPEAPDPETAETVSTNGASVS